MGCSGTWASLQAATLAPGLGATRPIGRGEWGTGQGWGWTTVARAGPPAEGKFLEAARTSAVTLSGAVILHWVRSALSRAVIREPQRESQESGHPSGQATRQVSCSKSGSSCLWTRHEDRGAQTMTRATGPEGPRGRSREGGGLPGAASGWGGNAGCQPVPAEPVRAGQQVGA